MGLIWLGLLKYQKVYITFGSGVSLGGMYPTNRLEHVRNDVRRGFFIAAIL